MTTTTAQTLASIVPFPHREGNRLPPPPPAKRPARQIVKVSKRAIQAKAKAKHRQWMKEAREELERKAWADLFYEAARTWSTAPDEAIFMLIAGSTFPVKRSSFAAMAIASDPDISEDLLSRAADAALGAMSARGEIVRIAYGAAPFDVFTTPDRPVGRGNRGRLIYVDVWPHETEGAP